MIYRPGLLRVYPKLMKFAVCTQVVSDIEIFSSTSNAMTLGEKISIFLRFHLKMPKCVASQIIDNPIKYRRFIDFLKEKNWDNLLKLPAEQLREIHHNLFRELSTSAKIEQLRSFIKTHPQ
ncbi:unnamed protein product [Trichogramma brassicae]|uniref:Uncharacterized protein n=1 Tax=Trichogramma brassicae TaxID=86971 RepID=A0A6H5IGW4_9HYME|nr:unnamed protein product [Trichogramma brassicae]